MIASPMSVPYRTSVSYERPCPLKHGVNTVEQLLSVCFPLFDRRFVRGAASFLYDVHEYAGTPVTSQDWPNRGSSLARVRLGRDWNKNAPE